MNRRRPHHSAHVRPLGPNALVKPRAPASRGSIYLPESAHEDDQAMLADVVAVGPGRRIVTGPRAGERVPMGICPGDVVVMLRAVNRKDDEIQLDDGTYMLALDEWILGVVEEQAADAEQGAA